MPRVVLKNHADRDGGDYCAIPHHLEHLKRWYILLVLYHHTYYGGGYSTMWTTGE
ncbi:MAG: hypothetical protein R2784_13435 [Saprospiraceae bacterium]